jgi:hypothetical protein
MSPIGLPAEGASEGALETAGTWTEARSPAGNSPGAVPAERDAPPRFPGAAPDPQAAQAADGPPFPGLWPSYAGCCSEPKRAQPGEHQQQPTNSPRRAPLGALRRLEQLLVELLVLPIRGYQRFISPWTPPTCRFRPTCSAYALEALRSHGMLRGGYLALRRILRCHPFSEPGPDPVPAPRSPRRTPL